MNFHLVFIFELYFESTLPTNGTMKSIIYFERSFV